MTSVTNITSQAPAPVSVRTSEVRIDRPSSRTASTSSPLNVTTSPGPQARQGSGDRGGFWNDVRIRAV